MDESAARAASAAQRRPSAGAWYRDGLRFACARCGNCCAGKGAVVVVSPREIEALARVTGMTPREFRERHTQERFGDTVLRDVEPTAEERARGVPDDGACEWLVRNADGTTSCRVHAAKPDQCRTYPFWPRVIATPGAWAAEGVRCKGIDAGDVVPADEIERRAGLAAAHAALDLLLEELDAEVADMGATCWVSGKCCDFPKAGHRLYTTRLEAERFARGFDLASWDPASGLCPAWKDGRCTAREHRPSACRTYFCEEGFEDRVQDLTERTITRLRWLHEKHGLPWDYADWIVHLAALRGSGAAPATDGTADVTAALPPS